jgi:hypothetical protein
MGERKVSISLDEASVAVAEEAAAAEKMNVSAWLARAIRETAFFEDGIRAVAEVEAEYGPFSEEAKREAREWNDRHGIGWVRR